MDAIDRRVLELLEQNPRGSLFRDEEREAVERMSLYIWHPISDVYEMPDGSVTARITDAGRRAIGRLREIELVGLSLRKE